MRLPLPLLLLPLLTPAPTTASNDIFPQPQRCVYSLYRALKTLTFAGPASTSSLSYCTTPLAVYSLYASALTYCSPSERHAGIKYLDGLCREDGGAGMPAWGAWGNLTAGEVGGLRRVGEDEDGVVAEAVVVSGAWFELEDRSVENRYGEIDTHHRYGLAIYGFWGGVLVLGMLNQLVHVLYHKRLSHSAGHPDIEGGISTTSAPATGALRPVYGAYHWLQTHVIVPRAFGSHTVTTDWATIPTRLEAVVVFLYWALSIILCSVSYHAFTGDVFWSDIPSQLWRYVSDRTGIMAISNLPWLWLFAGRNNVFLWATGWKFSTFNLFHRNIARVATLQAMVHSIGYTVQYVRKGTYQKTLLKLYIQYGVVAMVTFGCLVMTSFIWIRRKSYEVFLVTHIALAVVLVVAMFYHVSHEDGEYNAYLWPLVAIWSFDRFLRVVRLLACNIRLKFSGLKVLGSEGVASYSRDSDVIRLEVTPGSESTVIRPGPGQHYFLYQPASWRGFENHPFTLGAWHDAVETERASPHEPAASTYVRRQRSDKDETIEGAAPASDGSSSSSGQRNEKASVAARRGGVQLVFWIRPYDGWTRRLRDACLGSAEGVVRKTLLLEGPYGTRAPLHNFETVLLVAGGTGITAALPYIQDHVQRARGGGSRTRRMRLVWSCRQAALLRELCARELGAALELDGFDADLFCTRGLDGSSFDADLSCTRETRETAGEKRGADAGAGITIQPGRAAVRSLIVDCARDVTAAGAAGGSIAVLVCGPAAMADEARDAVQAALKEGGRVAYVEETFGW